MKIEIRETISFELGKEIKEDVFHLDTSVGQMKKKKKKFCVPIRKSNLRLWILCSDALPLSHRDSTVSEVYYKVHMTCVQHTARISNVNSIMFVDRNKRDGKF